MSFLSYAQNLEDAMLWRALRDVEQGFYVDVGAYDPEFDSVTRSFYDRGWRGINIEPIEECFRRFAERRPEDINLRVAVGDQAEQRPFYLVRKDADAGLSTLNGDLAAYHEAQGLAVSEQSVPVRTLAQICEEHVRGEVHFLKIDAEGSERTVLAGANFAKFRPWIVLVEAIRPGTLESNHQDWEGILDDARYRFVWFDGLNRFYVPAERYEELAPRFSVPLNVFDQISRVDHEAEAELRASHAEIGALQRALGEVRASMLAADGEKARLSTDLDRARDELAQARDELSQSSDELARARDELGQARDEVVQASGELAQSCDELARARDVVAQARATLARTEQALVQFRQASAAETAALADERDAAQAREAALAQANQTLSLEAETIERLRQQLRWEAGPGALRVLLPLARALRRTRGTRPPPPQDGAAAPSPDVPAAVPHEAARSTKKRLARLAYWPVRPVLRPLAWRCRTFLVQGLLPHLPDDSDAARTSEAFFGRSEAALAGLHARIDEFHSLLREDRERRAALVRSVEAALMTMALQRSDFSPVPVRERGAIGADGETD